MAHEKTASSPSETVRYRTCAALGDLELLHGTFKRHAYRPHTHPGYVIAVVTGGVETVNCRGTLHYSGPGDILFVNPEEVHDGQRGADEGWQYRVFYPRIAQMQALAEGGGVRRSAPYFADTVVRDPELAGRLAQFHVATESGCSTLGLQQAWTELLGALVARHARWAEWLPAARSEQRRIRLARERIEAHYDRPPSLDRLAGEAQLSPFHFLRLFKAETGLSPHAYLIQTRLKKAKALLEHGTSSAGAAADTGFSDQSHFIRHFKAAYGVTPGRYRAARAS